MSERDCLRASILITFISIFVVLIVVLIGNWNQTESIRDLQRRVGQLESERR